MKLFRSSISPYALYQIGIPFDSSYLFILLLVFCLSSISRVYWSRDWLLFATIDPEGGIYEEVTRLKIEGKAGEHLSRNCSKGGENRTG